MPYNLLTVNNLKIREAKLCDMYIVYIFSS